MRTLITLLVCFISAFSFAQQWEDTLRTARKLYHQKRYGESLEKYKTAQRLAPKSVDLSDEMGQTAYKAEDFAQAEKCYNQSVSKKGTQHEQAKTYHNLGNTKFKQKKYDEAITSYKEALRRNPNDEQTRYNLSEAMKKQQQQSGQQPKQQNGKQQSNQQSQEQPRSSTDENQAQNGQKESQNQQKSTANQQTSGSKLSDKSTEKALDELVKKEMETKKKLGSNKGKNTSSTTQKGSGKDW